MHVDSEKLYCLWKDAISEEISESNEPLTRKGTAVDFDTMSDTSPLKSLNDRLLPENLSPLFSLE